MGLIDKILKKEDGKKQRKVGNKFDETQADEIFDTLDEHECEGKKLSKSMEKEMNQTKESLDLIKEAEKLESGNTDKAIELYKKAITINPDNGQGYVKLANLFKGQNDLDSEIEILKLGIKNIQSDKKAKDMLVKRLKEINS